MIVLFMTAWRGRKIGSDELKDDPATEFLLGKCDSQGRFNVTYIDCPIPRLPPGLRGLEIPQKAAPMCAGVAAYHVVTRHPC